MNYKDVVALSEAEFDSLISFLDKPLDVEKLKSAIDNKLYRNKS